MTQSLPCHLRCCPRRRSRRQPQSCSRLLCEVADLVRRPRYLAARIGSGQGVSGNAIIRGPPNARLAPSLTLRMPKVSRGGPRRSWQTSASPCDQRQLKGRQQSTVVKFHVVVCYVMLVASCDRTSATSPVSPDFCHPDSTHCCEGASRDQANARRYSWGHSGRWRRR